MKYFLSLVVLLLTSLFSFSQLHPIADEEVNAKVKDPSLKNIADPTIPSSFLNPNVLFTGGVGQNIGLLNITELSDNLFPSTSLSLFIKLREGKTWFRFISLKANSSFNLAELTLRPTNLGYQVKDNEIEQSVQEFDVPDITSLFEFSNQSYYAGVNVFNTLGQKDLVNSGFAAFFDIGYSAVVTPITLDPAMDLATNAISKINEEIRELSNEIANLPNTNPVNGDDGGRQELQNKIEQLSNLSDITDGLPRANRLNNLNALNRQSQQKTIQHLSIGFNGVWSLSNEVSFSLFAQYLIALQPVESKVSIFDTQSLNNLPDIGTYIDSLANFDIREYTEGFDNESENLNRNLFQFGAKLDFHLTESWSVYALYKRLSVHDSSSGNSILNRIDRSRIGYLQFGIVNYFHQKRN